MDSVLVSGGWHVAVSQSTLYIVLSSRYREQVSAAAKSEKGNRIFTMPVITERFFICNTFVVRPRNIRGGGGRGDVSAVRVPFGNSDYEI